MKSSLNSFDKNISTTTILNALAIILGIIFFAVQNLRAVQADAAWLTHAAILLLDGHRMTEAYFDNNPPLSYIIFLPAALISKLGFSLWTSLYLYCDALLVVAFFLTVKMLGKFNLQNDSFNIILIGFFLAILSNGSFSQKDWLIALMIFPFLLAQLLTISQKKITLIEWTALAIGTPFILLKPHYGLLPVILILYRTYTSKRLTSLFKPDFFLLFIGATAYAIAIYFYFYDFVKSLPLIWSHYITTGSANTDKIVPFCSGFIVFNLSLLGIVYFNTKNAKPEHRAASLFLFASALMTLIYFLQHKGFILHLTPALIFLQTGALLFILQCMPINKCVTNYTLAIIVLFITNFTLLLKNTDYRRTPANYRASNEAKFLIENAKPNGFFIEAGTTSVIYPLSLYTNVPYAMRFPSLWFLPRIVKDFEEGDSPSAQFSRQYFSSLIAEDIKTKKPTILLLVPQEEGSPILNLLARNEPLKSELKNYSLHGNYDFHTEAFERLSLFGNNRGTIRYNVYRRVNNK